MRIGEQRIGELWADDERPTIDGDWIRGILVLGRASKNPVDTDGGTRGKSKVTRKFNKICESETLYKKFDGAPAHIGPHRFDGAYPDADRMGKFANAVSTPKGVRMDLECRRIGEAFHPQAAALRDNIEHGRPFGGFSPLFDGDSDMSTGEVQTVDAVCSIDWVPNPGSVRSIMESEADYEIGQKIGEMQAAHEKLCGEHKALCDSTTKFIGEAEAREKDHQAWRVAHEEKTNAMIRSFRDHPAMKKNPDHEALMEKAFGPRRKGESEAEDKPGAGGRTEPIPEIKTEIPAPVDPFTFVRGGAAK